MLDYGGKRIGQGYMNNTCNQSNGDWLLVLPESKGVVYFLNFVVIFFRNRHTTEKALSIESHMGAASAASGCSKLCWDLHAPPERKLQGDCS